MEIINSFNFLFPLLIPRRELASELKYYPQWKSASELKRYP